MIRVEKANPDKINIDISEVVRYLGYGKMVPDLETVSAIKKYIGELKPKLSLKAVYDCFDVSVSEKDVNISGIMNIESMNLAKNLKGCEKIILFAATLGIEPDRLLYRLSCTSPHDAVIVQAIGTVAIEEWCNILCDKLGDEMKCNGYFLRPRFSPGYGDFSITSQKQIFNILDCGRKIGLTLTDSCMMVPGKSVTAVIGLSGENLHCGKQGCEFCNKKDCSFRR